MLREISYGSDWLIVPLAAASGFNIVRSPASNSKSATCLPIFVMRKINKSVKKKKLEKVCLLKSKLILNGCYSGQDLQLFSEDEELSEFLLVEELLKNVKDYL